MPALCTAIQWVRSPAPALRLLDQRLLPGAVEYIDVADADAGWHAIKVGVLCVVWWRIGRARPPRG